jgi:hypothetical protein
MSHLMSQYTILTWSYNYRDARGLRRGVIWSLQGRVAEMHLFGGMGKNPHVLRQIPVAGRLEYDGTFAGRLTIEELTVNDLGQLAATGVLAGTATPEAGNATPIPPRTVITPASLLDLRGTCATLVLDIEPIFLEPLRQEVTLGPITLDMHAMPKDEHLLGTTLCALARLQE